MSKPKIDLKPKLNPLLASLPDYLKDPKNFEDIQKKILDSFISTCGHSDLLEWAKCKICTRKMLDRRRLLKHLGFKNAQQYMAWRAVHENIKKRFPLMDWKTGKPL